MVRQAQQVFNESPLMSVICEECHGSGEIAFATFIHEPGCGYGHESSDAHPCDFCSGFGWVVVEAPADYPPFA